jgi:hypothetical protein
MKQQLKKFIVAIVCIEMIITYMGILHYQTHKHHEAVVYIEEQLKVNTPNPIS